MKILHRKFGILLLPLVMVLVSCVSNPDARNLLADRTQATEEALGNGSSDTAALLGILLRTDLERGRLAYQRNRFVMTRNPSAERLYDPPRHYRHREMVKRAKEDNKLSEEEYGELKKLGERVHDEWLGRRNKISRDRAVWGFPR